MRLTRKGRPIESLDQWFAAAPPKGGQSQWCDGRSAKECARAWLETGRPAVPAEIQALFDSHPHTQGMVLSSAEPEAQIRFDRRRGEPRNADLAFLGHTNAVTVAGTVEAKADESFDALLPDTLVDALERWRSSNRSGGLDRAKDLVRSLLPAIEAGMPRLALIRYQLLTAVAGTLAWARENDAARAVLVIHEFRTHRTDPAKQAENAGDLNLFLQRLTGNAATALGDSQMLGPLKVTGAPLFDHPADLYIGKAVRHRLVSN